MSMTVAPWQTIESAPKDGTRVLIAFGDEIRAAYWDPKFEWMCDWGRYANEEDYEGEHRGTWTDGAVESFGYEEVHEYEPTHWMPLPAAPLTQEEKRP